MRNNARVVDAGAHNNPFNNDEPAVAELMPMPVGIGEAYAAIDNMDAILQAQAQQRMALVLAQALQNAPAKAKQKSFFDRQLGG